MTTFNGFFKAQTWDKVTANIVDLSWLITVYQGFDIIYSFHGTALDRGTLLTFVFAKLRYSDVTFSWS